MPQKIAPLLRRNDSIFFFLNNGVIHLVGKYLSTYYVFSSILGPENTVVNKADKLSW